jgi:hypothetical protein
MVDQFGISGRNAGLSCRLIETKRAAVECLATQQQTPEGPPPLLGYLDGPSHLRSAGPAAVKAASIVRWPASEASTTSRVRESMMLHLNGSAPAFRLSIRIA